ncbi:MAG: acyltransferase [Nocardioidaceae bacterium]|nr:acyltransferase [Nocardioidaceae bacterium]
MTAQQVRRHHYPQLDTMRGFAAVAVVATHVAFWSGVYNHGTVGAATQRLEVGVAIFFVLSGFLLSLPYLSAGRYGTPHDSVWRYFWKRALRILPVYWVCVVAALVLIERNHGLGLDRWLQNFTLTDVYRANNLPSGLGQMWSLSIEVSFYVLLPLLGALLIRMAKNGWQLHVVLAIAGLMYAVNVVWTCASTHTDAAWGIWALRWLPSYLGWFAWGIALAALVVDAQKPTSRLTTLVTQVARDRAACWICAGAFFAIISTPVGGTPLLEALSPAEAVARNVFYGLVAALLILPCVLGQTTTPTARLMSTPALRHLGTISYSLFCCHLIVLYLAADWLGFELFQSSPYALFAVVLSISLVLAELLYRFVETPFLRLKSWRSPRVNDTKPPTANAANS